MVWILYPTPFMGGQHVPSEEAWIEREVKEEQLLDLLSGVVNAEAKKTPGKGIVVGKSIFSFFSLSTC